MINISNIERFATHDGPGIRTAIFLKGCPLHCPWCANPETWSIQPVLLHDERKCVRCHNCLQECDKQAISFTPQFTLDLNKCNACGKCINVCIPDSLSIAGKSMSIDEILAEVSKDDAYYKKSNGGITLSGGEPLFQQESLDLLKALKQQGYHTAVETTGMYSINKLKEAEPFIDLFLHDIKHLDKAKLKDVTGASLETIINNLNYLANTCANKVIIRVPVIPGFNQDILEDIILFAASKKFKEVDLLPYHSLGKNKWENMQKEYIYKDLPMMNKEELNTYIEFGKQYNITVKIGG